MAHLISFSTARFDVSKETPNPINPIYGEGVLTWIREKLAGTPYTASEPDAEDWGWYMNVDGGDGRYMVGASGEPDDTAPEVEWTIQVHKERSFTDRVSGRNKLTADDPLVALLERVVRGEPAFRDVNVDRNS